MIFDSITFLIFFAAFFAGYHLLARSLRWQNAWTLLGSCVFYGFWDVRFLGLLLLAAGIDYVAGILLDNARDREAPERTSAKKKRILAVSMVANLGVLFAFKYFDFFAESAVAAAAHFGMQLSLPVLRVALPVGISFYTFQSMSYTIDIYRGYGTAERNPVTYFSFVSFFPHMVAGPIQRASHLLAQLNRPRSLDPRHVREGLWLVVYGYFLKEVIADPAATFVDRAFHLQQANGAFAIVGTLAFGLQIYGDFLAYSLIARGTGRLLGIEFIWNFNQPYVSTSMQEFWRRWHISLSTWLRDYLYISLGGNRKGALRTYINLFVTMVLGGLWHGASWNFVLWGALHGAALAVERLWSQVRGEATTLPSPLGWIFTQFVVFFGWFLFRCSNDALLGTMLRSLSQIDWTPEVTHYFAQLSLLATPLVLMEIWQLRRNTPLAPLELSPWRLACLSGVMLAFVLGLFGRLDYEFIYFQF